MNIYPYKHIAFTEVPEHWWQLLDVMK